MAYISLVELGATCKLCVGTYISSVAVFVAAILIWRAAAAPRLGEDLGIAGEPMPEAGPESGSGLAGLAIGFGTLAGFVAVPSLVYLILAPDFTSYIGACGTLPKAEDTYSVMIPLDENAGGKESIEVFDPLCPACKGFEERLAASGLDKQLHRKAVLFPLDATCNYNVGSTLHPGACTISEAVLCADTKADAVIAWSFAHQDEIRTAAAADPAAAEKMVLAQFPDLKSCVGSPAVKTRLNRSLRWAVANKLPVLTPQLYVEGTKLCDEDTDLGMDWALSRLLAQGPAKKEATP
jgi:hypothetical protein